MAVPTYFDRLKATVVSTDGLETVPTEHLEIALGVIAAWFPRVDYVPSVTLAPEIAMIYDAAFWRHEAVKQLDGLVKERKAPKTKAE